ncbi:MAG: NAD-dependent epimerase/dehydratase family protein [Mariniblastus sp.]|nr:NAD-dependent epimerase/dehydratase family protein [Mariniblastus sp.]
MKHLTRIGVDVTSLVRPTSDRSRLEPFQCKYLEGDVTDAASLTDRIDGFDWVFHAAGLTKTLKKTNLDRVNISGAHNVAEACYRQYKPPVLISVSSLAAAGPSQNGQPPADPAPVSKYGRSKLAGEKAIAAFADRLPITIVRPPIVIGPYDRDGFQLFEPIQKYGLHLVPTLRENQFSLLHAQDLAMALVAAAKNGRRIAADRRGSNGIYYVSAERSVSYSELGRMIAEVMGRPEPKIFRMASPCLWGIGLMSEVMARIRRRPAILSLDKIHEAVAGSWTCSYTQLKRDTGFQPGQLLMERLRQTADWYFKNNWLKR